MQATCGQSQGLSEETFSFLCISNEVWASWHPIWGVATLTFLTGKMLRACVTRHAARKKKKSLRNAFMSNSFPMNLSGWISCTTAPRGVGELACGRWWLAAKQGILEDTCQKEYLSRIEWLSQVWWCKAVTLVLEAEAEGRQCSRPAWGAYWEFVSSGVLILNDSFFIKCGGGMPKCLLPIPLSLISSQ